MLHSGLSMAASSSRPRASCFRLLPTPSPCSAAVTGIKSACQRRPARVWHARHLLMLAMAASTPLFQQ